MTLYVLDTSVVGYAQQRHPVYQNHLQSLPAGTPVVTTIITVGEDLSGWLPACRRAIDGAARVTAYARLQRGQKFYERMGCLPFDEAAAAVFDQLRAQKIRIGTNDLAVAIVKDGKVVFAKGYGVRELGEPTPVDENTLFSIASNTKAFTAAAATKSERMRRGQTTPTTEAPQIQRTLGYALCLRCLCGFLFR